MHSSPLELGRKRVELNVSESFKYFTQELLRKYLKKNICNFKSPISPWRGPQWKLLFWAFFLNSLRNPTTQKISFHCEAPFLLFQTFGVISKTFVFWIYAAIFWVKIRVITLSKTIWFWQIDLFSLRNKTLLLNIFWLKKNALIPTLTFSALGALLVGWLVVVACGLYLARHLLTL